MLFRTSGRQKSSLLNFFFIFTMFEFKILIKNRTLHVTMSLYDRTYMVM